MDAPKQARSRISTGRLLRTATQLIAENGYERTTLAAIGERAGYSHGLVTRRFGSKEGLLVALIDRMTTEWIDGEILARRNDRGGIDAVTWLLRVIRRSINENTENVRSLYTLMFEAIVSEGLLKDRIVKLHDDFIEVLAYWIECGVAEGDIAPDVDPRGTAELLTGSIRGVTYLWMLLPDFDPDKAFAELEVVAHTLLRTSGASIAPPTS